MRQWLKQITSHTGYACCERCIHRGENIENRIVLTKLNSKRRTDESFRNQQYSSHHVGFSPLLELPVDMIYLFPLDYMHLLCLGIGKRLMRRLLSSKTFSLKCSLSVLKKTIVE